MTISELILILIPLAETDPEMPVFMQGSMMREMEREAPVVHTTVMDARDNPKVFMLSARPGG